MTPCKQLSLFNCSASASVAAANRTNTASGSSLKYSKLLQEPFLIAENHVDPKNFYMVCAHFWVVHSLSGVAYLYGAWVIVTHL